MSKKAFNCLCDYNIIKSDINPDSIAWKSLKCLKTYEKRNKDINSSKNLESTIRAHFFPNNKNKFTFHGVGQGLFYTGNLNDIFGFVYDCGAEEIDSNSLSNAISSYKPPEIDFLVVSHLHYDHISGIRELMDKRKVSKVYLPYFDLDKYEECFKLVLLSSMSSRSSMKNLEDDKNYQWILKLYRNKEFMDVEYIESMKNSKIKYKIPHHVWDFWLFNKRIDEYKLIQLKTAINSIIKGYSLEEYIKKNGLEKLAEKYKLSFPSNINPTSLIMLHHSANNPTNQTLLTGDAVFDRDLNDRIYKRMMDIKTICQIPHHGAKVEWKKMSDKIKNKINTAAISFGKNNRYHHPNSDVILDLSNGKKDIKNVTQGKSFKY